MVTTLHLGTFMGDFHWGKNILKHENTFLKVTSTHRIMYNEYG